ncbi:nitrite/sulfite reductase [Acidobacteria bacterium AH-259-A15]|nr:nitrite/sulfite reductase [Acidobacteria bacterium AH-259-A15]
MITWREKLADQMDPAWAGEIDIFELQMEQRRQGQLGEKIFAETRLRRGVYGQRYDNGQRHDGIRTQQLQYPSGDLTKGPETLWHAPGMQRIKIPFGGLTPDQMDVLADLSEEYADGILHVTTRQDFQLHFVNIDDTPSLMRRLAAVGITTREACGNSVRNVTACPLAGVCRDEVFDVTPYAKACSRFLLGHADVQDFGRKFKIAFSGCKDHACGLVTMHDMGAIAVKHIKNGKEKRGFALYVGGGLGAVPHQAKLFDSFLPEDELFPIAQAISRVFARLGEKKIRSRARIKFLVAKLGIDEFRRLVLEERKTMPEDPRWNAYLPDVPKYRETPLRESKSLNGEQRPEGFEQWYRTNVYRQRQPGYAVATISLRLGDISAWQMRELADMARRFAGENVRTTVEQNIVLRWVSEADLPDFYQELKRIGLGDLGAGTIVDVTACPGTDTCKLGIASSRGLAAEIRTRLAAKFFEIDEAVKNLRIKISGCFNSCGQHHISDIGFYGTSRTIGNHKVPHFQVVLGGKWVENAGAYGLAIGSVPAKRIPETLERITERYVKERQDGESFQDFVRHIGKKELRGMLEDLMKVPPYQEDASFYTDWGDPREFSIGDMAAGECAGEVVSLVQFDLAAAERMVFEAQVKLDDGEYSRADELAYKAMLQGAKGLIRTEFLDVSDDPDTLVSEFRKRFYDTKLFHDRFAGGKFAHYLFRRHKTPPQEHTRDAARQAVEEAQLFIEAVHACQGRIAERRASAASLASAVPLQAGEG